jgi:quercetin dioxygenase-like cupin family protein
METDGFVKDYRASINLTEEHYGKSTLFQNRQMLVGLNCFQPGQQMEKHGHSAQTRFYVVMEGTAEVQVGDELSTACAGNVIWVPAGNAHRIKNNGSESLVLMVGFTPSREE